MALDFLNTVNDIGTGIGSLLGALGKGKPKLNYGPTPSEMQANSLFQALLDPNNSLVKQNTDANMQKGMLDFLMSLKQMQMAGNRAQARGVRSAFFSPERADESINYLLTRGQPAIVEKARETARNDIYNTANALKGFAGIEQSRINAQNQNAITNAANFQAQGGYGGMFNAAGSGLIDFLKKVMPGQFSNPNNLPWLNGGR